MDGRLKAAAQVLMKKDAMPTLKNPDDIQTKFTMEQGDRKKKMQLL